MKQRRGLWLSLAGVALFLLVGRAAAIAYADYRWYAALGATDAWNLQFSSSAALRSLAFVAGTLIAFLNLWGVRHSVVSLVLPRQLGNIEIGEEVAPRTLMMIVIAIAFMLGLLFALSASNWQGFELAFDGVPFNESDPLFRADIGFFVYWLPFEESMYTWVVSVVGAVSVIVISLYALTPSLRIENGRIRVSTYARRHIALLGGVALALLAWSFRLDAYGVLTNGSGPDGAFGWFDQQLGMPISMTLAYAAIGASFVVAWAGWTGQTRVAVMVMTVVLLLTPTMQYVLPTAVRWASAPVDPRIRERPFAANRAGYTRSAFRVDRIDSLPSGAALRNVREAELVTVWDPSVLTRAVERTRRRGPVTGAPSIAMTAAGPALVSVEAPAARDDPASATWTLVRSLASVTDERGALVRVDAQGRFPLEDQNIGPVLVYDGARGPLVVTDAPHHPAAPLMESFSARLAEAWSQQNFRLLASPSVGARMVKHRDVHERVRALVPFFAQSTRITPIAHGDSLFWSVELYSTTLDYPLARPFIGIDKPVNYLRHAATALVQAYTGRVTFIPDDDELLDPIALTWMKRLPVTLAHPQSLPPSLAALLPPDVDGTEVLASAFALYGTRREGISGRHVPSGDGSDTLVASHAPTFLWLPSLGTSVWIVPVIDATDHVSGLLIATGGPRRAVHWHPVSDTTLSWGAIRERLQQAATIASSAREDGQAAGRIRLLPLVGNGMIALQPFYTWPAEAPPHVSHVALVVGDTSRAATSVAAVVGAPVSSGPAPATPDAKQERLRALYAEMRTALQKGDWQAFGAAFEALGALLDRR